MTLGPTNGKFCSRQQCSFLLVFIAGVGSSSHQRVFLEQAGTHHIEVAIFGDRFIFESVANNKPTGELFVVTPHTSTNLQLVPQTFPPFSAAVHVPQ
jgi:hypothetical protein